MGLATPVSLSFLIFSFTILTVATYYFSMASVSSRVSRLSYAALNMICWPWRTRFV